VLAEGATVPVRGAGQGGWVPVRCGGRDGWISASYLRLPTASLSYPSADRQYWGSIPWASARQGSLPLRGRKARRVYDVSIE
ncbi:MAG: hypothetical protein ACTHMX_17195, partial [Thermomicrobiales bacterium]